MHDLLGGEVGIWATRDSRGGTSVQGVWTEAIPGKGGHHHRNDGGMQIANRGDTISRCLCILPHLDSALCQHNRAFVWASEERAKVQVGGRSHTCNEEAQRDAGSGNNFKQSYVQRRDAHLRNNRHESDGDWMGHHPGRGRWCTVFHPVRN